MRLVCMINLWLVGHDMAMVWVGHNSMNLLVRSHGGVVCDGRNSMNLLVRSHGGSLCDGRNSRNLLLRFRGGVLVYINR